MGEGLRARETQNLKQAPGSECQRRGLWGLELVNHEIMTRAEVGGLTEPPRRPYTFFLVQRTFKVCCLSNFQTYNIIF